MISQSKNRVQAIKSKFENLNNENAPLLKKKSQLFKQKYGADENNEKFAEITPNNNERPVESDSSGEDWSPKPNQSYLYSKSDVKRTYSDAKSSLSRQTSDPGKKLHRSHAFRCDRSQMSPKRHGSCNGRSETTDFTLKPEKKLSKERLKQLGNFLEVQMKKENFMPSSDEVTMHNSVPDDQVPSEILQQYAKVIKPKKKEEKSEAMTDSGVSSETENLDEDKSGRIKKLMTQFEKADVPEPETKTNLELMDDLAASSETMKLERKNPHLILTDTLKKALKQPLPTGPPPKKPPRTFAAPIPEKPHKDPKIMLKKLEQVLERRKSQNQTVTETSSKPKEMHYLCTEILDITQRALNNSPSDPISRCFNSLNCTVGNSMSSLPYTRLSTHMESDENAKPCSCVDNEAKSPSYMDSKCLKCQRNDKYDGFKCHLTCKCEAERAKFYVDEHIYDEPYIGDDEAAKRSTYGTLNNLNSKSYSKSLEDLRAKFSENTFKNYYYAEEIDEPSDEEGTLAFKVKKAILANKRPIECNSIDEFFEKPKKKKTTTRKSSSVGRSTSGGVSYIRSNSDDNSSASHLIKIEVYEVNKIKNIAPTEHWKHADVRVKYYAENDSDKNLQSVKDTIYNITKQLASKDDCVKYFIDTDK